jgi:hypothetical protein
VRIGEEMDGAFGSEKVALIAFRVGSRWCILPARTLRRHDNELSLALGVNVWPFA